VATLYALLNIPEQIGAPADNVNTLSGKLRFGLRTTYLYGIRRVVETCASAVGLLPA